MNYVGQLTMYRLVPSLGGSLYTVLLQNSNKF